jgi:hypothetical protein
MSQWFVVAALTLAAAVNPTTLHFVDGKSTFAAGGSYIPGVHYVGVQMQQGRVLVDADWNELQVIQRTMSGRGGRKSISVLMYDRAGKPVRLSLQNCQLISTAISIPITATAASPLPSGFAKIILHPTPAPRPAHMVLHCKRIVAQ